METHAITATPRPTTGKGIARRARRNGSTPGVLYRAGGVATPLSFNVAELAAIFRKSGDPNSLIAIAVDGTLHNCLVREIQRDPVSRDVLHVDFYEVESDQPVVVDVVVNPVGRAAGTRAGGTLRVLARTVKVRCPAGSIPAKIDVDVTNLGVAEFVKAGQIVPPEGASVVFLRDYNVLTVEGKRTARDEGGGAAAAAAPAAAAKAAPAAKPAPAKK